MVLERIDVEVAFKDEISSRLDNVLSTMIEFGATTEQVAQAQKLLSMANKTGAQGIAQMSNALRTMVDESEDADKAMRSLALATDVASAAGLKMEDAGRELGKMFKGDTAILRKFDAEAKRVADAIDKIVDPAERAAAAERELGRAMQRQARGTNRFVKAMRQADVSLSRFGLSVAAVGQGLAALGTAYVGLVSLSIKKYIESNEDAKASADALSDSIDRSLALIGEGAVAAHGGMTEFSLWGDAIEGVTEDLLILDRNMARQQGMYGSMAITVARLASEYLGLSRAQERHNRAQRDALAKGGGGVLAEGIGDTLKDITKSTTEFTKGLIKGAQKTKELFDFLDESEKFDIESEKRSVARDKRNAAAKKRGSGGGRRAKAAAPIGGPADLEEFGRRMNQAVFEMEQLEPAAALATEASGLLAVGLPKVQAALEQLKIEFAAVNALAKASDKVWTDLAKGGISLAFESVSGMTQALLEGGDAMQAFGAGLLASMGDLLNQAGMAFVLLGTGMQEIHLGITSPAGLIAIGVGMLALGGALKAASTHAQPGGGGGDGGKTAQALQRFGRQLFDRQMGQESREVMINIEGRQMRGYVLDVASDGLRTGSIPLTPVRRR